MMEMANTQQIAEQKEEEPKEEINQVTKNPKRVEAGKKGAAARKAKQESLIKMLHKQKEEITPDEYNEEPVKPTVHKTNSNLTYLVAGVGLTAGAFLGWKLFSQYKMSTVQEMKHKTPTVNATPTLCTGSPTVNPHHME